MMTADNHIAQHSHTFLDGKACNQYNNCQMVNCMLKSGGGEWVEKELIP